MGIKHFYLWFKKNYASSIITLPASQSFENINISVDNLALDLNGVFHYCAQKVYEYGNNKKRKSLLGISKYPKGGLNLQIKLFKEICERIDYYRKMVRPKKRIILCIDGVAGAGKMSQQRQRRFKAAKIVEEEVGEKCPFNANCITPGTSFMDYLSKYIDWYLRIMFSHSPEWAHLEVIFSNEKAPGEGEHKIIKIIRENLNPHESFCIHGLDADLIMLSLGLNREKMYILRENIYVHNEFNVVNISKFSKELSENMRWETDVRFTIKSAIDDFIFMCFLVGNDFLPHIPSLEILEGGLEVMLDVHKNVCSVHGHLTRVKKKNKTENALIFRTTALKHFFGTLSQYEHGLFEEKINKAASFFPDHLLEKHSTFLEDKTVLDFEGYKKEYYQTKFEGIDIKKLCHDYIEGMQWVLTYYKLGMPDWKWYYKFHYAPFTSDLTLHAESFKFIEYTDSDPIPPLEQLLTVLPPQSANLLPKQLGNLLINESPLTSYCPLDFKIDLAGKRKEWEGIALLPIINFDQFHQEYTKAIEDIDTRDARRNILGKSYIYSCNKEINYIFNSYYGNISSCTAKVSVFKL